MKYVSKTFARLATFAVISCALSINLFAQKTTKPKVDRSLKPTVGLSAPKVTKIDELSIKELLKPRTKPLLVNFWATWCIPCREEFPDLVELDREFKGKIDFITISLDDLAEINRDVPKFLAEMKATMPAFLLRSNDENGVIGSISKDWTGGLPFTVLYDNDGQIVHTKQGKIKPDVVRGKLGNLIKENAIVAKKIVELTRNTLTLFPADKYNYGFGIRDAKRDVAKGIYYIKRYGLTPGSSPESRRLLKKKYNIEYQEYGCMVSPGLPEYVRGYNEISKAAIKKKFNLDL